MRLKTVELSNFRQYGKFEIKFTSPKESNGDLHVIVGKMGVGKTNFVEALNWGLYGKGLFSSISREDDTNLLNNNCLKTDGQRAIFGRFVFDYEENEKTLMVVREAKYTIRGGIAYSLSQNSLTVSVGSMQLMDIDAQKKIQEVLPEDLREHFFFDGEGLDNYFKNAQGEKIRKTVEKMAQIDKMEQFSELLRSVHQKYLKKTHASEKNASRKAELERELDGMRNQLEVLKAKIKKSSEDRLKAREELSEVQEKLDQMKDFEIYRNKIESLQTEIQINKQQKKIKLQEKFRQLLSTGTLIFAWASIDFAFRQDSVLSKSYEFLPKEEIQKALSSNKCPVCERELDENHVKVFQELLNAGETYIMSRERYEELKYDMVNFKRDKDNINAELREVESKLKQLEEEINYYQDMIRNQDGGHLDELHQERNELQKMLENLSERIAVTEENVRSLEQGIMEKERRIREIVSDDEESQKNLSKADFVEHLQRIVNETVGRRKAQIRQEIENYTKQYLNSLMWKKALIHDVKLDEDFTVNVYDESGRIILDRLSGGERSILTLSFALALHESANVNIPIIIDRPLTNISGDSYMEMLEVLSNISKERQIIITLTDREYMNDDVVPFLNEKAASINIIDLEHESNVYLKNVK